jgi:hypothetical protein
MSRIIEELINVPVKSDVNEIVIYTNMEGDVIKLPKVGGSRADVGSNLEDPDCPDVEPEPAPEVPGG